MSIDPSAPGKREPPSVIVNCEIIVLTKLARGFVGTAVVAHLMMYSDIDCFCSVARLDPCLSVGNTKSPVETRYLSYDSFDCGIG